MVQDNNNSKPETGERSAIFPLPPNLPIAFCTLDTEGYILLMSDFAIQMMGYPSEKLIGRKLSDLFCFSSHYAGQQNSGGFPESFKNAECEMKTIRGDGEVIWIKGVFRAVLDESDHVMSYFVHLVDVTEVKMLERYVQQLTKKTEHYNYSINPNAEMVYSVLRSNQIYEQYLDGLADAIRGPITNISLRLHLLENDGSVESYRHVQILREQFHHVKAILKDLLKFVDVAKTSSHMNANRYQI